MSFFSMLKKSAKKIGKGVSSKTKEIYEDKMQEREIYKQELKKERLKQIKLKAKQKARDKYSDKKLDKFTPQKKEYF